MSITRFVNMSIIYCDTRNQIVILYNKFTDIIFEETPFRPNFDH